MGRWGELFKDDKDFGKYYCTDYLKEEDVLLFEIEDVKEKINLFAIPFGIISLFISNGTLYFGPREKQYVIGVGKSNLYVLYLGKHMNIPWVYEFKPEYVRTFSLDSIKELNIKRLLGLLCKMSIFTDEGDLVFYAPLKKSEKDYLKNILQTHFNRSS
jgi:hypothetical protein